MRSAQHYLNPIDIELANQGLSRTIALKSGQLATLIESLEDTDRLMISSHALAQTFEKSSDLKIIKAFDDKPYLVSIYLIEHRRTLSSPAHQWFKTLMLETLAEKISVSGS